MSFKHLSIGFFVFVFILINTAHIYARESKEIQRTLVSMRMIGHKILLNSGDANSRVLPIERDGSRYKIQFENDIEFDSEELACTIDDIIAEAKITSNYIVEVVSCESKKTIYNYEINPQVNANMLACSTRGQPKGCYIIYFTNLDATEVELEKNLHPTEGENTYLNTMLMILSIMLIVGLLLYYWKKSRIVTSNPNLIAIGEYQFDRMNSELLLEGQRVELTSKEADLLFLLYNSANTTLDRDVILKDVWGDEGDYVGRTLDVFISKLRKKLEVDTKVKIVNIRGVGYKLVVNTNV